MSEAELDQLLDVWTAPAPAPSMRRGLIAALPAPRRRVLGVPLRWALALAGGALCAALGASVLSDPVLSRFYSQCDPSTPGLNVQVTRLIAPSAAKWRWWFAGSGYRVGESGGVVRGSADLRERSTGKVYGYEFTMERVGEGRYRASFHSLQPATLKKLSRPFKGNGEIVPPPGLPAPRVIAVGESLDVAVWESGGERIYDRILLSWTAPDWVWSGRSPAGSAGVMRLAGPQLYVDGRMVARQQYAGAGPVVWVCLPGRGRFLVAVDPQGNARFTRAGRVAGNVVEFEGGESRFRIVCTEPIVGGGKRAVFVYHQESFDGPAEVMVGVAGPAGLHE